MRISSTLVTITISACLGIDAASFSAVGDFGGANPSGPWSYGFGANASMGAPGAAFTPMSSFLAGCGVAIASDCWAGGNAVINRPTSTFSSGTVDFVAGYLTPHPSPDLNWAILAFTAPAAGNYTFTGEIIDEDNDGGNGVQASALLADGTSLFGAALPVNFYGSPVAVNIARAMAAGETVYFAFGPQGDFSFDSVGLKLDVVSDVQASAAPVPEPATWLLALGGAGVLWARRRVPFGR